MANGKTKWTSWQKSATKFEHTKVCIDDTASKGFTLTIDNVLCTDVFDLVEKALSLDNAANPAVLQQLAHLAEMTKSVYEQYNEKGFDLDSATGQMDAFGESELGVVQATFFLTPSSYPYRHPALEHLSGLVADC